MKSFNDYDYTRDAILKQLVLIELHGKDGSAVDAGCQCINTKHTYILEGLAEEMQGFAKSPAERQYYAKLAELMRQTRKDIDSEAWTQNSCLDKVNKCIKAGGELEACKRKYRCL